MSELPVAPRELSPEDIARLDRYRAMCLDVLEQIQTHARAVSEVPHTVSISAYFDSGLLLSGSASVWGPAGEEESTLTERQSDIPDDIRAFVESEIAALERRILERRIAELEQRPSQ